MAKTENDGKFAEEFTGGKPLDWNRRADGSLVIITHDGKKVILTPHFLNTWKPEKLQIRRTALVDPEPEQSESEAPAPTQPTDWKPARRSSKSSPYPDERKDGGS